MGEADAYEIFRKNTAEGEEKGKEKGGHERGLKRWN